MMTGKGKGGKGKGGKGKGGKGKGGKGKVGKVMAGKGRCSTQHISSADLIPDVSLSVGLSTSSTMFLGSTGCCSSSRATFTWRLPCVHCVC